MKKPIFTIQVYNETDEQTIEEFACELDYNEQRAVNLANEVIEDYEWDEDLISVTVYAGEYLLENGDIYGEPFDIYTIYNRNEE